MSSIEVDWTRCDAHGLCSRLLPEVITLDEWGYPVIDGSDLDRDLVRAARKTAMACPALALRVERRP
ncbi:ferredoxin [Aeromicrobium sp.]|uniref:ferredoxin n=1 Tax=Aeromicrobium sp. TaxID=1871063 RepID=UPI0019CBDD47|nr:ferredoxin [Aeromicrobium sp.]MBC7633567.1 ferredoxin [Aeromicrobium sp.]